MIFIFCESYLTIVDTINAVNNEQDNFLLLSSNSSIVKLFSELYSPKNVFILPKIEIIHYSPLSIIKGLITVQRKKREILPLLLQFRPRKVIFFFMGFNGFSSWLIKKISRVAQIYYRPSTNPDVFQRSYNVKIWIKGFFYSAVYGIYFTQKRIGKNSLNGVSIRFLKVIKAREYPKILDMKYVEKLMRRKYPDLKKVSILVLVGGITNIDTERYKEKMNEIIEQLIKFVNPSEIGIKAHPRFVTPNIDIPTGCIVFPKYLAANLLMVNCRVVISYSSGTLFEAASQMKKAVSLLKIMKPISQRKADFYVDYLLANTNSEISFPESVEELIREIEREFMYYRNMNK